MKFSTILLTAALALAPVAALADEAPACGTGDPVALLVATATEQHVELVTYTGDDFTKYVNAVQKLFAPTFGDGADEVIEAVLDEDTVLVFLAKDGCLIARGEVDRANREQVLQEAGLNK